MLSEVDLPPVSGVELPWAGTEPERAAGQHGGDPVRRRGVHR